VAETLIGFVGAAATKSLILAAIILGNRDLFRRLRDQISAATLWAIIVLVAANFALFGFILGVWADSFEKLGIIPQLILTPLTFLGGTFYSLDMLPEPWDTVALAQSNRVSGQRPALDLLWHIRRLDRRVARPYTGFSRRCAPRSSPTSSRPVGA
jgi:ABC-type multidrug transport system permease subunit